MGNSSSHTTRNSNPKSKVRKPTKIHTNDELLLANPSKLDLLKLPLKWRESVWAMVDDGTKKTLRQVCRELKEEIDQSAGLYVMINSGIQENLEFVQSVKVKWATIDLFHLDQHQQQTQILPPNPPPETSNQIKTCDEEIQKENQNRNFLKYPDFLEGLQIFSQISIPLFTSLIEPSLKNLKSLIFQGESLTNSNLSSSYTRGAVLDLPALKHLAIEYDVNYEEKSQLENLGYNMIFILSSFHCPVLETFQLEPLMLQTQCQPQQQFLQGLSHASQIFSWENEFLKRFVQAHRQTLKNLCIFFHEFCESPQNEDLANGNEPSDLNNNENNNNEEVENGKDSRYKFPLNLSHYSIRCTMSHPGPSPPDHLYWKQILEEQQNLESFVVRAELWHDLATTFKIMDRVIQKNCSSLRDICIGSVFRESKVCSIYDFRVDFRIFSGCSQLVSLDLYSSDEMHHMTDFGSEGTATDANSKSLGLSLCFLGKNLMHLPKSVKYLKINGISLRSDEIQCLEFHENLEKITLVNVGGSGAVGVNYSALMALLRNESVSRYVFCGFNLDTDPGLLEDFIKKKNGGVFSHDIVIYKSYGKPKDKSKEREKERDKNEELIEMREKDKLSTAASTIQIDPQELCPDGRSRSKSRGGAASVKEEKTTGCFPWSNSNSKAGQSPRSTGNNNNNSTSGSDKKSLWSIGIGKAKITTRN